MVVKIFFVSIPNWKSYMHLSFDMRYCLAVTPKHNPNHFCPTISLQTGHICVGTDALHTLKVEEATTNTLLPNLDSEPKLQTRLSQHLVYLLEMEVHPKHVRQYGFVFGNQFPAFEKLKSIIKPFFDANVPRQVLNFAIQTNLLVENIVSEFVDSVRINISDYADFYPKHLEHHFFQTGDYFTLTDWPIVQVPTLLTLDSWSEYITIYGYVAIYKHEIAVNMCKQLSRMVFNLQVIEVSNFWSNHYIGIINWYYYRNICIDIKDVLKVNFNTNKRVETKNWSAVVIEPLPFALPKDLYMLLFQRKNKATGELINFDLNALLTDIIGLSEAAQQISSHTLHQIALDSVI